MLTEKALQLKDEVDDAGPGNPDFLNKSRELWEELFERCNPTKAEFCHIVSRICVTDNCFWYIYTMWKR